MVDANHAYSFPAALQLAKGKYGYFFRLDRCVQGWSGTT